MKYLILIAALCSTSVLAKELKCTHEGVKSTITLEGNTLYDEMERVVAEETSTGHFETVDAFGPVSYTIHGNKIIMRSMGIIKEYTCDL